MQILETEKRLTEEKGEGTSTQGPLLPYSQPMDHTLISLVIVLLEIIEKPPSLSDKLEEAPAGVMILHMDLEVPRQIVDALTEQRDLNLW